MRGIMHCFSGSFEMAKELIKMGFYISFAGPLAFPNSRRLKEAARDIPLEYLLIETDSPYLTPPPNRGKRNEPANVIYVAEEIARLKGLAVEKSSKKQEKRYACVWDKRIRKPDGSVRRVFVSCGYGQQQCQAG